MESLVSLPPAYPSLPLSRYTSSSYYPPEDPLSDLAQNPTSSSKMRLQPPASMAPSEPEDSSMKPSRDNCDRRRPGEDDPSRLPNISQQVINQSMTPFLREHIPSSYAPVGKPNLPSMTSLKNKDPNSKYCYRHRPDSKCRRAADESKMALIQSELEKLPAGDRQVITNVWSMFSASPTKHRELMLQGIITQCCFPQLSTISREVHEQLKIDFISTLPVELSLKILCYLDCSSLCKAAQVNRRWNALAEDDVVWHRMCEQHIGRKCEKCQWGLPRLEKKRLREWRTKQQRVLLAPSAAAPAPGVASDNTIYKASTSKKRDAEPAENATQSKRQRVNQEADNALSTTEQAVEKFRPWKAVYRDRFKVGSNWQKGRCTIKTFSGHTNGVICLQFDDNMLATGSYDATIKIWDIEKGEVIRTLQGHTSGIRALQFDDRMLVSGSLDGTVKIWNWRTGTCINTLEHQDGVLTVHMEGDLLASGSKDRSIKIFNFKTQQSFSLRGHTDWVNQVRLDVTSRTLLTASDDCTVKLWDLDSRTCIKTYEGHAGQVQQVLALPDDFEFEDETTRGVEVSSATGHHSETPAVPSSPQSSSHIEERAAYGPIFVNDPERPLPPRYMLTGSLDNTLRLWDTATGKSPRCFWGHVEGVWSLAADTLRYVSGANDATGKLLFFHEVKPWPVYSLFDSQSLGSTVGQMRTYLYRS
ncbi:quinon protein alcohol dehydrogenase-like superfamily [Xylariaceae sp. FL0594]|nr:quinon protein alcohol dehydrogenase-like superfamily [Xylariaceae sp. FL0594]